MTFTLTTPKGEPVDTSEVATEHLLDLASTITEQVKLRMGNGTMDCFTAQSSLEVAESLLAIVRQRNKELKEELERLQEQTCLTVQLPRCLQIKLIEKR